MKERGSLADIIQTQIMSRARCSLIALGLVRLGFSRGGTSERRAKSLRMVLCFVGGKKQLQPEHMNTPLSYLV